MCTWCRSRTTWRILCQVWGHLNQLQNTADSYLSRALCGITPLEADRKSVFWCLPNRLDTFPKVKITGQTERKLTCNELGHDAHTAQVPVSPTDLPVPGLTWYTLIGSFINAGLLDIPLCTSLWLPLYTCVTLWALSFLFSAYKRPYDSAQWIYEHCPANCSSVCVSLSVCMHSMVKGVVLLNTRLHTSIYVSVILWVVSF